MSVAFKCINHVPFALYLYSHTYIFTSTHTYMYLHTCTTHIHISRPHTQHTHTYIRACAGQIPCPLSAMYGATKAFLTSFGSSLAAEVNGCVCVYVCVLCVCLYVCVLCVCECVFEVSVILDTKSEQYTHSHIHTDDGIDVLVVHPSPVDTRFYSGDHDMSSLDFFRMCV